MFTNPDVSPEEALRRYAQMLRLREFEAALLRQAKPGFQLLSRGEEAIAVGICTVMEHTDPLLCSGRSIGMALARGIPAAGLLAELVGKDGGPNRGRAGRAHVSMPSVGLWGAHGVVAGNLSVAAGVALAQQYRASGHVTACVFGDGACGAGALHETLNVAALWSLPLLLVVDNNGYAVSTEVCHGVGVSALTDLAAPFRIPAVSADGTDVDAVITAVAEAVAAIRATGKPRFLELRCTRMGPHSTATKEERSAEEVARFRDVDPLSVYEARLRQRGVLDDAILERIRAAVLDEMTAAEACVAEAPWPDPEEALSDA